MNTALVCNVCDPGGVDIAEAETAIVRPNIRRLQNERFDVWRCPHCRSIHAREEVVLDSYYRDYPFLSAKMDWRSRAMYDNQLSRLKKAGLSRGARILDYGCGSGNFVRYLKSRGYHQATGYDAYSTEFGDASVLEQRYDCIISQDVIEHVAAPWSFCERSRSSRAPVPSSPLGHPTPTRSI